MNTPTRKKSPRAPSSALDEAVERALRLYEKERRHAVPIDIAAKAMGYNGANNGTALKMIATMRYFGLLERPQEGALRVHVDVEHYKFNPNDSERASLLTKWLLAPQVFSDMLSVYTENLPSDEAIKYDLVKRGFAPDAATECAAVFRRSVEWSGYFNRPKSQPQPTVTTKIQPELEDEPNNDHPQDVVEPPQAVVGARSDTDRIPIRLEGNRKAWIEVPVPFYEKDKARIKAQIDLLLTDE
jgi:hypothetical protein